MARAAWFSVVVCLAGLSTACGRPGLESTDREARATTDGLCASPSSLASSPTAATPSFDAIDEDRLMEYVEQQAAISRRYRDDGHQFWGRIIGTDGDHETARWMADELRDLGVEVSVESLELEPQWLPASWSVRATMSGDELRLESAWPAYGTAGTGPGGLDLEPVYLGWGTEADMAGRDVAGRAAIIHSMPLPSPIRHSATVNGALRRAESHGAAAVFVVIEIPGNLSYSLFPPGTNVPTFALGSDDGADLRERMEQADGGDPLLIHVELDTEMVPGLTTSVVRGEIPGAEEGLDEDIVVVAHRDAFFEGLSDNATGVATLLGLADYYSSIPRSARTRSLTLLGTPGHHDLDGIGQEWLLERVETDFANTALVINAEHTAHTTVDRWGDDLRYTNSLGVFTWTVNGSPRLEAIADCAFEEFGIPRWMEMGGPTGEFASVRRLLPSMGLMHAAMLLHSDAPERIPGSGLLAVTRSYARVIDEVNRLPIEELRRPE